MLLSISAIRQWEMVQLDINNAFLNRELQEQVFMDIPPGFQIQGEHKGSKMACKLNNSIYRLIKSSRQWFNKFSQFMMILGFTQSKSNYSLFYKGTVDNYVALLVYVDDIIITGPNTQRLQFLKQQLSNMFKLKALGSLDIFWDYKLPNPRRVFFSLSEIILFNSLKMLVY